MGTGIRRQRSEGRGQRSVTGGAGGLRSLARAYLFEFPTTANSNVMTPMTISRVFLATDDSGYKDVSELAGQALGCYKVAHIPSHPEKAVNPLGAAKTLVFLSDAVVRNPLASRQGGVRARGPESEVRD